MQVLGTQLSLEDPKAAIRTLEGLGFKVFVSHRRCAEGEVPTRVVTDPPTDTRFRLDKKGIRPSTKGGVTRVTIVRDEGETLATAEAVCSSIDGFDRKLGTRIALGRALKQLQA